MATTRKPKQSEFQKLEAQVKIQQTNLRKLQKRIKNTAPKVGVGSQLAQLDLAILCIENAYHELNSAAMDLKRGHTLYQVSQLEVVK